MYSEAPNILLYGDFISIDDAYLIDITKSLKIIKFNYVAEKLNGLRLIKSDDRLDVNQFCISITQIYNTLEIISFLHERDRDLSFSRIQMCIIKHRR